jgi:hypothetical protein
MGLWFYVRNNQQVGPVSLEQMQALAGSGQLLADDHVWQEGMPDWVLARTVPELQAALPSAPPPFNAGLAQVASYQSSMQPGSERNWMAITALILGILSVPFACIPACAVILQVPGIIFGSLGLKSAMRRMAMAGLILSCIGVVLDVPSGIYGYYQATHDPANPFYKLAHPTP